jgi:xylose isomerase
MDTFARGLLIAQKIIDDKVLSNFIEERYGSFNSGIGAKIMAGKIGMKELEQWICKEANPVLQSGRQEMLENVINSYIV